MSKTYYVDSENVGDSWIDLMEDDESSNFHVFYTGHSPRIDYKHMLTIMNAKRKPEFLQCAEGNNALDFQLVSYLGYQLRSKKANEIIIVSNDTGFDAVVNFWSERGANIHRLATNGLFRFTEEKKEVLSPVSPDDTADHQVVKEDVKILGVSRSEIDTIINCIGSANVTFIHQTLVHFYGNNSGLALYKLLKAEGFSAPNLSMKKENKITAFCKLIFSNCSTSNIVIPSDLIKYLCSAVTTSDDKNSMKKKLASKYGADASAPLHKMLKPFYTTIAKIKQ